MAYHASSYATGQVTVDGGELRPGDTATIGIQAHTYSYNVQSMDTLLSIRDALIALINGNAEEVVTATPGAGYSTSTGQGVIVLQAKVPGPAGNGIAISGTSTTTITNGTAAVTVTATTPALCCANVAGAPVTTYNRASAGETIYLYATGLGLVGPNQAKNAIADGTVYNGPAYNDPNSPVNALASGITANVISAGLLVGGIGVYQVVLQLSNTVPTNNFTQITISQDIYTSNIVTIPVYNPNPSSTASTTTQ